MKTKFRRFVGGRVKKIRASLAKARLLKAGKGSSPDVSYSQWKLSLKQPTRFYESCFCYFHYDLPGELQNHRQYFTQSNRGFGEDAFHVMWFLLAQHFQPRRFLEIGVYRGQSLSLMALLQKRLGLPQNVTGISPFLPAGDSVTEYLSGIDYHGDTLKNFAAFGLEAPSLIKAFSTDETALQTIRQGDWDIIYIDGNHDYEIALSDWKECAAAVKVGGLVVLDDSGLTTAFKAPAFATAGHPGPSQLAQEIDRNQFEEILQVGHNRVFLKLR